MERDFLGMKREPMSGSQDAVPAAFLSSPMQWHFANKAFAMHQFTSYEVAEEERQKKYIVNPGPQTMPIVDAFEASGKKFPTIAPQKFRRNIVHQFPIHAYNHSQNSENLGSTARQLNEVKTLPIIPHNSVPVAMNNLFFKIHGSQSSLNNAVTSLKQQSYEGARTNTQIGGTVAGGLASVRMPKPTPTTAQLTIFYAGSVNVFDDISLEEVQEILSLAASKGSHAPLSSPRPEAAIQAEILVATKVAQPDGFITKKTMKPAPIQARVASPCPAHSSVISVSSHNRADSRSSCSTTTGNAADAKTLSPLTKINQEPLMSRAEALGSATATNATPRAVPQARKASLARFLERRKDRVITVMPYSCSKKSTHADANGKMSNNSPLSDVNITIVETPSTKLEI